MDKLTNMVLGMSYNPAYFDREVDFPDVVFSYASKSRGGKGKDDMWAMCNLCRAHNITSFNGYMVKAGEDWQLEWYGLMPEAKVVVLILSPEYFASKNCVKECVTTLRTKSADQILPVQFGLPNMRGRFLGEGRDEIKSANVIRQRIGNAIPPPDQGTFADDFPKHGAAFIKRLREMLEGHPAPPPRVHSTEDLYNSSGEAKNL